MVLEGSSASYTYSGSILSIIAEPKAHRAFLVVKKFMAGIKPLESRAAAEASPAGGGHWTRPDFGDARRRRGSTAMILILSGEGPTDMGKKIPTPEGSRFPPGPMAELVDRQLFPRLGGSILRHECPSIDVRFLAERDLSDLKSLPPRLLYGLKRGKNTAFFAMPMAADPLPPASGKKSASR